MKNKFKKILSAILAVVLILSVCISGVYYCIISDSADKITQTASIDEFCLKIVEFNKKYKTLGNDVCEIDGKPVFNRYENRLIVKTAKPLLNNAFDSVYYDDIAVFQYTDDKTLQNDFEKFKAQGLSVSRDYVYSDCADITENAVDYNTVDKNYAYTDSGASYARKIFENSNYDEITVAMIDTGIDYNHEVFKDRYIENNINFSTSGDADDSMDDQGHGTATSGIIVLSTPNNVKVKPYKVLNSDGCCTSSQIIAALEYIMAEKDRPDIVNMSLGGYDLLNLDNSTVESYTVSKLIDSGVTVCAAAGNEKVCCDYGTPANCDGVITVSSHGQNFKFSNYSDYGSCVDICAPGEKVLTAKLNGGLYSLLSGTSFSAPFVSAACTYILMQHPDFTPSEIKEKLKSTAVKPSKYDELCFGSGILSFANIIEDKQFKAPKPSVTSGVYNEKQTVSFDVPDGCTLIYKTDSMNAITPGINSSVYINPITVDSDTIITYALIKDGKYASPIESAEYEIQYYADENDFVMQSDTITGYNGDKTNIIVPDTINGVAPRAYTDNTHSYTHIVFPDSVGEIGDYAFAGNTNLRSITAHGVTTLLGKNNFYNCEYLQSADMPNLQNVTEGAFCGCKSLHSINFDKNITQLKSNLFKDSGIISLNLPNAEIDPLSNDSVFSTPNLVECYAPQISIFGTNMFYGCMLLYKYTFGEIKSLGDSSVYNCQNFINLDVSGLEELHTNALHGCFIKNFCAPDIINFEENNGVFGSYCYCKTLDLPNFEGNLSNYTLHDSTLENIYLDKVYNMGAKALENMAYLKILYLPKVEKFYTPSTSKNTLTGLVKTNHCAEKPSPDIIWIPNATMTGACELEDFGCIFAPKLKNITLRIHNKNTKGVILISKPTASFSIIITCSDGISSFTKKPLIVTENELITLINATYNKALFDDFRFVNQNEYSFEYACDDYNFSVPFEVAKRAWNDNDINKNAYDTENIFIFDFTNDRILNARDFAVYSKALHNKTT